MALKTGSQLRTSASGCEVVVVRGTEAEGTLLCAGGQMVTETPAQPASGDAGGSILPVGKRYTDTESGVEVLVVKPGAGPLSFDGRELSLKAAKALPASD
ncbi:hypothetical protein [Arthrobacter sp. MMS18-M83]|uniref:hypothetical protein n=1 Tax=Arthrobacter sp. MMS18-M83 TaxID=2996261 RepID=UPI00227C0049|nr:hypothetical protein [Arthrobacter sp. MMS18-M83]WAH97705.1 hypothetical protein OW521_02035 [Arthrobacter sp. MMS18-M83]